MSGRKPAGLADAELGALRALLADLRGLAARVHGLTEQLGASERRSRRSLVRDRLLCVLQDSLAPAVRDLESIESAVRAPEGPPA